MPLRPLFHDHLAGFVEDASGFEADVRMARPLAQDPCPAGPASGTADLDVGVGEREEAFHITAVQGIVPGKDGLGLRATVGGGLGNDHPPVETKRVWCSRANLFEVPVMG